MARLVARLTEAFLPRAIPDESWRGIEPNWKHFKIMTSTTLLSSSKPLRIGTVGPTSKEIA
jgi:hypothetical protein